MTPEHRAKQFAPFAAITGLDRAIEQKRDELENCERREFSEEIDAALNKALCALRKGERAAVRYYRDGRYHTVSGTVERIDEAERWLKLGSLRILFDELEAISPAGDEAIPFP
jgi:hypothetical protein